MAIINTTIPNLIGGISQQPDRLKFDGQCNDSLNCYATVKDGLKKRPYSRMVANIGQHDYDDHAFTLFINRTVNERYVGLYDNTNGLKIWNLNTGVEATVNGSDAYLDTGALNPDTTLKSLTVSDYTFITNRSKTVNLGTTTSGTLAREALIFIKQGDYEKEYNVEIDGGISGGGAEFTHISGNNTSGANADTSNIASALHTDIDAHIAYESDRYGNVIRVSRADGNDFPITSDDGLGGRGMQVIYKQVDDITDLPTKSFNNFQVEIAGNSETGDDNYWVKFKTHSGEETGEGSWREVVAPAQTRDFDENTMPITLVNTGLNSFDLQPFSWSIKTAGDSITNPAPSFVGKQISDVFFYKNRLGFISDENIIFSESGNYGNFWRNTVQQLLDSTPIDVAVSHTKVAILRHAVATTSRLILFSDRTQFALKGDELLTNATISITPVTNFENDLNVNPTTIGRYTYFGFQRGQYTGIREYYLDNLVNDFDQNEITSHTPSLIPQDLKTITGTTSEDQIVFLPRNSSEFFLYSYHWQGREKVMSSWSRHKIKCDFIVAAEFIDSDLYIVTSTNGYLHLQFMPWEQGLSDGVILEEGTEAGGTTLVIGGLSNDSYNGIYADKGNTHLGAPKYELQTAVNSEIRRGSTDNLVWNIYDTDSDELIAYSISQAENPWEITYWMEV